MHNSFIVKDIRLECSGVVKDLKEATVCLDNRLLSPSPQFFRNSVNSERVRRNEPTPDTGRYDSPVKSRDLSNGFAFDDEFAIACAY